MKFFHDYDKLFTTLINLLNNVEAYRFQVNVYWALTSQMHASFYFRFTSQMSCYLEIILLIYPKFKEVIQYIVLTGNFTFLYSTVAAVAGPTNPQSR
jgi:hypothetical protein